MGETKNKVMETKKQQERIRLVKHIEVLKKSYKNIVEVMEEDVDKTKDDNGKETVSLKDEKIKTYAEGIRKSAETLNYLYSEITEKEKELSVLDDIPDSEKPKEVTEIAEGNDLAKRLK